MARKMTEWPSKRGPITKIMPSDGCIGDTVPWRWESGTISTNLDGIWGMSVQRISGLDRKGASLCLARRKTTNKDDWEC